MRTLLVSLALAIVFGGSALAQGVASSDAADTARPSIAIARIVSSIPQGYDWITLQKYWFSCFVRSSGSRTVPWTGKTGDVDRRPYIRTVATALNVAGFSPADDPDNLFQKNRGASDLAIAANVKDIKATLCAERLFSRGAPTDAYKFDQSDGTYLDIDNAIGTVELDIDWQLYSKSQDKIVYASHVHSSFEIKEHARGNLEKLIQAVMDGNIKTFIGSPDFKAAVLTASAPQSRHPPPAPKLTLLGAGGARITRISDAVGSVVLIQSNGGHGSGALLSTDGYVLTAAHVVGDDKYVKIRWSDGLESLGEVARIDKPRDAAMIKTDPRGRAPLAIRTSAALPGDTVFAIGAPIDPKLQSTVTRGVISANDRIIDGFSFIQSDVTVAPGDSGGPLLDDMGHVLGFTAIGLRTPDAPTGLNFFVPIDDALRFLSAEPQ